MWTLFISLSMLYFPVAVIAFPCRNRGYVHLSLFQSKGWTSRSKGITIAKCITYHYSFCQSGRRRGETLPWWTNQEGFIYPQTPPPHKRRITCISRWGDPQSLDRLLMIVHFPIASRYVSGCQVPLQKVGCYEGPDCKKLCLWVDH